MQPQGEEGKHHHHNLSVLDVLEGFRSISNPHLIINGGDNRILVVSVFISSFGLPLMIVIEINAGLINDKDANINKIITMYPKDNISGLIEKTNINDILFRR